MLGVDWLLERREHDMTALGEVLVRQGDAEVSAEAVGAPKLDDPRASQGAPTAGSLGTREAAAGRP
jgi:hypothetical protein